MFESRALIKLEYINMAGQVSPWGSWSSFVQGLVHNYRPGNIYIWENLLEGVCSMNKGVEVAGNSFAIMVYLSRKKFGRAETLSHMVRLCG